MIETRSRSTARSSKNWMSSVSVVLNKDDIKKYFVKDDLGKEYYTVSAPESKRERKEDAVDVVIDTAVHGHVKSSSGIFLEMKNTFVALKPETDTDLMVINSSSGPFVLASVSSAPMKCMRINKRMKFKSSANVCSSHSVRDRIQRSWMHWEITSTSDFIPWVPTFSYLLPKIKKRETFAVESLQ